MTSIEDDYMVEQVPTTASDPALSDAILPRTPETGRFGFNTQGFDRTDHILIEVSLPIIDQIFGRRIAGERLSKLLRALRTARMLGDDAMQDSPQ